MKCRYTFNIKTDAKMVPNAPIQAGMWEFEFLASKDGKLTGLCVTIPVANQADWPAIRPSCDPKTPTTLDLTSPDIIRVRSIVRAIEGLLAPLGIERIESNRLAVEWIPESDRERQALKIRRYERHENQFSPPGPLPFDIAARAVFAASASTNVQAALSFYRRGVEDIRDKSYIDAFYNFFFVLESELAGGRFKQRQMEDAFLADAQLCKEIENTKSKICAEGLIGKSTRLCSECRNKYATQSVDTVVRRLIKLRGKLHHHRRDAPGAWHPEDQDRFLVDAYFVMDVSFHLVWRIVMDRLYQKDVIAPYDQQFRPEELSEGFDCTT